MRYQSSFEVVTAQEPPEVATGCADCGAGCGGAAGGCGELCCVGSEAAPGTGTSGGAGALTGAVSAGGVLAWGLVRSVLRACVVAAARPANAPKSAIPPATRQSGRSAKPRHGTVALHGRAFDLARHAASVAAPNEKPMSAA